MEKKTIDTLRVMLCGEIEDIAKQGKLSHESLDILKDLVETEKNLVKIEKYDEEKMEKEEMKKMGGMGMAMPMEGGYSQRKFYIDADYQPGGSMSYARGGNYDMGNSYARGGGGGGGNSRAGGYMYDMGGMYAREGGNSMYEMGGQSRMYYDPMYDMPMYARAGGQGGGQSRAGGQSRLMGYARTSSKEEMIEEMKELMQEAGDEKTKMAIQEAITKLQKQ